MNQSGRAADAPSKDSRRTHFNAGSWLGLLLLRPPDKYVSKVLTSCISFRIACFLTSPQCLEIFRGIGDVYKQRRSKLLRASDLIGRVCIQ